MSGWKSTEDQQLDELREINLSLTHLNENLLRLCYILTESSISSSPPFTDDPDIPAVGFSAGDRTVSVSDGCCQTSDCITNQNRNEASTQT